MTVIKCLTGIILYKGCGLYTNNMMNGRLDNSTFSKLKPGPIRKTLYTENKAI